MKRHLVNNSIFLLWLFLTQLSCTKTTKDKVQLHQIADVKINIADTNFVYIQDTVYYKQKHFTGYQFALHLNGDTALLKSFYNGLEEGFTRKWHTNKQLAEERFYLAGKKEGLHRAYWQSGRLKFEYHFLHDEFDGLCKEWYANGRIFKEFNYKAGHEEGSIKMFWENGKIKTNYIIKNGRRYGLLGTKNCINVADSVSFN